MSSHRLVFYQSLCFFRRERSLLPNPLCPTIGFKETGPCNCKLPMKKMEPLASFLAKTSRSAVIAEINESGCWAPGLLVAAEMKRQQLKSALGMSIPIRIFVWDTVITCSMGSSEDSGFLEWVLICSLTTVAFLSKYNLFPSNLTTSFPKKKNAALQTQYSSSPRWRQMSESLPLFFFFFFLVAEWGSVELIFSFISAHPPWAGVKQLSYKGCPGIQLWNKPASLLNCPPATGINLSS